MVDTLTFASGFDAWVLENNPDTGHTGGGEVRLWASERKGIVQIPMTGIHGKTIPSAILYGHVKDGWVAQTITAHLAASGINPATVTWDNFPSNVAGLSGTVTTGALAGGATSAIPVTEIVQAIANGAKNHGFILTTDASAINTANLRSFTSGKDSWQLVVQVSDAPAKPTNQRPLEGGVDSGAPVLGWDGGAVAWASIQVQVDPAADSVSPAFDSGTVTTSDSTYDLSASTFTPIASGSTTQWRVRAANADGTWGDWSDWASFTYTPQNPLVVDSPTGGTIGDPTFSVLAHLATGTLSQYQVRIAKGTDRTNIVYDTGEQPPDAGGTIARGIPWRDPDTKRRIIRGDDTSWQINIRAWDTEDRAEAVGETTYVEAWVTVTFTDGANEAPADYTVAPVTPGDPRMVHTWTRSVAADKWLIMTSHGEIVHTLTVDDVTADAGTYTFTDRGETQPYQPTIYKVRAVDAGVRSAASNTVTVTSTPGGFWIIPDDGTDPFLLDGDQVQPFTKNTRADIYSLLNGDTTRIVYGYEGISGTYVGELNSLNSGDVLGDIDRLEDLRRTPTARPQLIWASQSIRAQFTDGPFAVPDPEITPDNQAHAVTLGFVEDPD